MNFKNKISKVTILVILVLTFTTRGLAKTTEYTKIDADNTKETSYWKNIPIVSKKLLENEEVTIGGEGCQWPLSIAMSSDGKYLFYGTDVGGLYRSTDNGKTMKIKKMVKSKETIKIIQMLIIQEIIMEIKIKKIKILKTY